MVNNSVKILLLTDGLVAEWLASWTQAQKGLGSDRSRDAVVQTVHTHHASVHQAAKLVPVYRPGR